MALRLPVTIVVWEAVPSVGGPAVDDVPPYRFVSWAPKTPMKRTSTVILPGLLSVWTGVLPSPSLAQYPFFPVRFIPYTKGFF